MVRQAKQIRLRKVGGPLTSVEETKGILKNTSTPKTITLRRTGGITTRSLGLVSKQKQIQENLKALEKNTQKKRIAQAIYYGEADNSSPLLKFTPNTESDTKDSVHTRLGMKKHVRLRRVPVILSTSNNRIIKGKNRQRSNTGGNRLFSVQGRIQRIRQQHMLQEQDLSSGIQTRLNSYQNRIKLQRTRPVVPQKPTFLTVQVKNEDVPDPLQRHSPLGSLTPKLQAEIKMLQKNSVNNEPHFIPCEQIHVKNFGFTKIPLHERFSLL